MEPSSVEDGNFILNNSTRHFRPLQWSRPQLRTETMAGDVITQPGLYASMEPSSVEDGNQLWQAHRGQQAAEASMEPSSVEDGNWVRHGDAETSTLALQWSRPQLRTETTAKRGVVPAKYLLQWSRPQLRTETRRARCNTLALDVLQWSRPQLRTETPTAFGD